MPMFALQRPMHQCGYPNGHGRRNHALFPWAREQSLFFSSIYKHKACRITARYHGIVTWNNVCLFHHSHSQATSLLHFHSYNELHHILHSKPLTLTNIITLHFQDSCAPNYSCWIQNKTPPKVGIPNDYHVDLTQSYTIQGKYIRFI